MGSERFNVLREQVRGQVIEEDDAEYEAARLVYNGMISRRPAAVLRVSQVADVLAAVRFARGLGIEVAVRGGGHSAPGFGTVDGGLGGARVTDVELRDLQEHGDHCRDLQFSCAMVGTLPGQHHTNDRPIPCRAGLLRCC